MNDFTSDFFGIGHFEETPLDYDSAAKVAAGYAQSAYMIADAMLAARSA